MTLYMKVTRDKYELPVAVADSEVELARMCRVDRSSINHSLHKTWKKPMYIKVEVDDEE